MTDPIQHPEDLDWSDFVAFMESETELMTTIDARADMMLEALADLERAAVADAMVARERIDTIERWLARQNAGRDRRTQWLTAQIEALAVGYDFGKKKSRDLPHGVFGYRAKRPTVEIVDKATAIEWATVHCPEAVKDRATKDLTKTELVKLVTERGIHLDPDTTGLRFVDEREDFYINPRTEK
jgi:phage host-nuclease inhibitor protein Gam